MPVDKINSTEKKILVSEVVSPYAWQLGQFLLYMPNPDEMLTETEQNIRIYREMLLDARLSSLLDIRKAEALNYPSYVQPGNDTPKAKEIAAFVSDILQSMNLYQELKELLSCLDYGYAFAEVVWKDPATQGGKWIPDSIMNRRPERFGMRPDGTPVLIEVGIIPLMDPYKYIVHRHNVMAENPYGSSVLKACYWPWIFKKAGWRFWLTAAEKFGVPTVLALFDTEDEEKARERSKMLAEMLSGIKNDAAVALSNVKEVTTLEVKGDLTAFKTLIDACDQQISYAITGQSLASGEGLHGTRAQALVHKQVLKLLTSSDAKQLAKTLSNTLLAWITELNFGTGAPKPMLTYDLDDYASWEIISEALDRGVPVSRSAMYTKYNIPEPTDEKDSFTIPEAFRKTATPITSDGQESTGSTTLSDGFFLRTRKARSII